MNFRPQLFMDVMRTFYGRRPAPAWQVVLIATVLTATLATIPHYTWWLRTGGGGTPPYSAVESAALEFLLSPMPHDMSFAAWMALIAGVWAVASAVAAIAWVVVRRTRTLSLPGVVVATAVIVEAGLWLLVVLWPIRLPP